VSTDATIRTARKLKDRRDERIFRKGNSHNDELKSRDTCALAPKVLQKRQSYPIGHVSLNIRTVTTIVTRNYPLHCENFKVS
jgi:hypothetical protein